MEQRLHKVLAAAGVASRREAEKLIASGHVSVDGKIITELGTKVDPEHVTISVDGAVIDLHPRKVYILLNKPRGYTSSRRDPHAVRLVTDLVKDVAESIYPVGRLDVDTEGLLVMTNDGDFAFKLTHPSHKVEKSYRAEVRGAVSHDELKKLSEGLLLDDGMTAPAKATLLALHTTRQTSIVELTITEGRNRQVRRMLAAIAHPVTRLIRTRVGNLTVGKLMPGEWRFLTPQEVDDLLKLAS